MLEAFDRLAVAEMSDIAMFGERESDPAAVMPPMVDPPPQNLGRGGWDWVIGACVLGLVILATRR